MTKWERLRMWIVRRDHESTERAEKASGSVEFPMLAGRMEAKGEAFEEVQDEMDRLEAEHPEPVHPPCPLCGGREPLSGLPCACGGTNRLDAAFDHLHEEWARLVTPIYMGTMPRPTVVCLCGSTRFYAEFRQANYERTMAGEIVLSVGFFVHAGDQAHGQQIGCTPEQKRALDELHCRKIDLCDYVLVLNVGGYIGESTRREIEYAEKLGRRVEYLEALHGPDPK